MKTIIFLTCITAIHCDLSPLRTADTQFILIGSEYAVERFKPEILKNFDAVHAVKLFNMVSITPLVKSYLENSKPNDTLHILTKDEYALLENAKLNDLFNLPGITLRQIMPFRDKVLMKETVAQANILVPKFVDFDKERYRHRGETYIDEILSPLKLPVVVKPKLGVGCINVMKLNNRSEVNIWSDTILKDDNSYQLEEFYEGQVYNCDAVIKNGEILFFSPCEYLNSILDYTVGKPMGLIRLPENSGVWRRLFKFAQQLTRALPPPDGMINFEVIATDDNGFVFIEIGARPSGAMVAMSEEKNNGFHYDFLHFQLGLGMVVDVNRREPQEYYSWVMYPNKEGMVVELKKPNIVSKYDLEWLIKVGDYTQQATDIANITNFAGSMVYHHPEYRQLYQDFLTLRGFDPVVVVRK